MKRISFNDFNPSMGILIDVQHPADFKLNPTSGAVNIYADKLLIGLTDDENNIVLKEFDVIEKSMEKIANMPDIEKVEPMTHALDDFSFILREDVAKESIPVENLLQNCDSVEDDFVSVPKVVG